MSTAFSPSFIEGQKKALLTHKQELMNHMKIHSADELHHAPDSIQEEGDQAQTYLSQNLNFGLREREIFKLREIEVALSKIESGAYGYCEDTEDPIEEKRLIKIPWARYSIAAAEQIERESGRRYAA